MAPRCSSSSPFMMCAFVLVALGVTTLVLEVIGLRKLNQRGVFETNAELSTPTQLGNEMMPSILHKLESLQEQLLQERDSMSSTAISKELRAIRTSLEALVEQSTMEGTTTVPTAARVEGGNNTTGQTSRRQEITTTDAMQEKEPLTIEQTADALAIEPLQSIEPHQKEDRSTVLQKIGGSFDPSQFYPQLTLEDYQHLEHFRPSGSWLTSCAKMLAKDATIVKPFPTNRVNYALGDCIKACDDRCATPQGHPDHTATNVGEDYSATMAGHYGHYMCPTRKNFTFVQDMLQLFGERDTFIKPDPDALVIHLRLGDVMEGTGKRRTRQVDEQYRPDKMLRYGGSGKHNNFKSIHSIFSVDEYLAEIDKANATKVVLVGGSHKPDKFANSRVYAGCLSRGLALAGKQVELRTDIGDPDLDFYFMSHAKLFMRSTGGYSRYLSVMVKMLGGQVVENDLP
ncbi:expressed unknown protein [Seminavis robusta]|uniref:Uncharacterized protein n=1 Tax=Seminavis robusta TaxID=568900 RepID=A0A9N8EX24_9STRA|nr:expressed unknown protein [Seminavis robusta]|eukprot:Sro1948_g307220.1 n/a (456) ;mRNA; f:13491-15037